MSYQRKQVHTTIIFRKDGKMSDINSKEYLMNNKFSKSWINMRIPYDHAARSHVLIDFLEKNNKENKFDLIDMCSGSGSFLIWSIKRGCSSKKIY